MGRRVPPIPPRRNPLAGIALLSAMLWWGCSDAPESPAEPEIAPQQGLVQGQDVPMGRALEAQERNSGLLMAIPGVVGHGVGLGENGEPTIHVFTLQPGATGVPSSLDGVPTRLVVSGRFDALTEETAKHRPAPLGVSIGHPDITAGTLGFKVKDVAGNSFILSNNHVMANENDASIGDDIYQPGPFDGGGPNDKIGMLSDFVPIDFGGGDNLADAAIASVASGDVLSSTPADEGYGQPSSTTVVATLDMPVQKYGRTTEHTQGTVSTINATVDVCYEPSGFFGCAKAARFVNQFFVTPGTFSAGGDSGSGIVTADGNLNPVGLLFAGSSSYTVANPIDDVLSLLEVTIDDGGGSGPPTPVTDVEITGVSAPTYATGGDPVAVSVTVRNAGNQDLAASFQVSLDDATDGAPVGSQTVNGLTAGTSTALDFTWNTAGASFGDHLLVAMHDLADDDPTNDSGSTNIHVTDPSTPSGVHSGDLDAVVSGEGLTYWSTTVDVMVHGPDHQPVNGATVVGTWSDGGLIADTCTTGEDGENGTCVVLSTLIGLGVPTVTFSVTSVTLPGQTYQPSQNHDDEGDSDGTSVTGQNPNDPNSAPTANDVIASGDEDAPLIGWTPDVADPDGDPLTCSIASQPASGTAAVSSDCSSGTYTPDPDFNGADVFTYSASDGSASDGGTVDVTVNPVADAPVATGDAYAATTGETLNVPGPGVLSNDSDADGDVLTAVLDVGPSNDPSFTLNADGSFSYTSDVEGPDSFTYHAFDGGLASGTVLVTIDVTAPPPAGVTVEGVNPDNVPAGQSVEVEISGSGFAAGATVTFEGGSGPAPTASNVAVIDGSTIEATFTAKGGGPRRDRPWDVRVTNPDGSSDVLPGGFTVTR